MRLTLFHNPMAGKGTYSREELLEKLREAGHTPAYQNTKAGNPALALEEPGEMVVCAGGDGTVAKIALRLIGKNVPLAILPLGKANNIAQVLGINGSLEEIIAQWPSLTRKPWDIGVANGEWGSVPFVESFGFGLFPQMLAIKEMGEEHAVNRRIAHLSGVRQGVALLRETLKECKPWKLEVRADGQRITGEYLMLQVMNAPLVGANLELAPDADPGDGMLDVVVLKEEERDAFEAYLERRMDGDTAPLDLRMYRARHIEIIWDDCPVSRDDKLWPSHSGVVCRTPPRVDITVRAAALEILSGA